MTGTWKAQDAKARFSALLDAAVAHGPQIVTRRGVETAVLVPIDAWRGIEARARPGLKELLLSPSVRTDTLVPARRKHRRRKPPLFE